MLEEQRKCQCVTTDGRHAHSKNSQENTMTEIRPTPLTDADVKRRYSWGMAPHKSIPGGMYTVASAAADFDRWLTAHDAEVRAEERAKLQDRIEELEKNLSYEVEQKIKLADTLRDERAKRPDRAALERIAAECEADIPYDDGNETAKLIGKRIREALALAPEASEEDKRAYREGVRVARETYKALLARLDASGDE